MKHTPDRLPAGSGAGRFDTGGALGQVAGRIGAPAVLGEDADGDLAALADLAALDASHGALGRNDAADLLAPVAKCRRLSAAAPVTVPVAARVALPVAVPPPEV